MMKIQKKRAKVLKFGITLGLINMKKRKKREGDE